MLALVFIGCTGAGKTTLARAVAEASGLTLISSGDIARDLARHDSYTKANLERGDWAPELAMRAEVLARVEAAAVATGDFVIDGFPRRLEQLQILESVPGIQPVYFVLYCDPLVCLRRLIRRGRQDDHPDAVATRFQAHREHTQPMIEMLARHHTKLDGEWTLQKLTQTAVDIYQAKSRRRDRVSVKPAAD